MAIPHHDDAITELPMKSLVVQLLEDLFKVSGEIHDPGRCPGHPGQFFRRELGMKQWSQAVLQLGRFPPERITLSLPPPSLSQPALHSTAGAPGQDTLETPPKGKGVVGTTAGRAP